MSRIGIMLRTVLRSLYERLARRIRRLFVPRTPEKSPARTMAESRKQALAAWEQLVSEHAPHLLQESTRKHKSESSLRWPPMEPFASSRQRAWPGYRPGDQAQAPYQEKRQTEHYEQPDRPRARPAGECPPENHSNTHPVAGANSEPCGEQIRAATAARRPNPASASGPEHQSQRHPVTTSPDSVRNRHTGSATESPGHRAALPNTAIPVPDAGIGKRVAAAAPAPEPALSERGYDSPAPRPPDSYQRVASTETTTSGAGPRQRASRRLEVPIPEHNRPAFDHGVAEPAPQQARGNLWPELPEHRRWSLAGGPRPRWAEASRRQRLLDEQRGVL